MEANGASASIHGSRLDGILLGRRWHEITGIIIKVGSSVSEFKLGDKVGVGCIAASCLKCDMCESHEENYCEDMQLTYGGVFWDGSMTYGGYSTMIVSHKRFVVKMPENLPLDAAAPLLCAGITMFSPMKQNGMLNKPGKRLGIVGLGGLGHVGVKLGKAFGLHVTVISTSPSKEDEAKRRLGADDFLVSTDPVQMELTHDEIDLKASRKTLDFIIDTVSAQHPLGQLLDLLEVGGTLHNITCDIEKVKPDAINEALERLGKNDVRYRFVIDIASASSNGVA
ncbi:putative cinnamyl alcohol dehydrogenase 6 [Platanthera zijinensis]|uniref:cinnamyl-alcohol dehydrogenase n=1 Tax=Platanthera zijinensis TaxID=2320716 RepID=A0AAP0FUJ7_9ASPA